MHEQLRGGGPGGSNSCRAAHFRRKSRTTSFSRRATMRIHVASVTLPAGRRRLKSPLLLVARILTVLAACAAIMPAPAQPSPRAVLVIDEANPSDGVPTAFSATVRRGLLGPRSNVAVYAETLDSSRFTGARQEAVLRSYLRE